jgi:hypothetical protein
VYLAHLEIIRVAVLAHRLIVCSPTSCTDHKLLKDRDILVLTCHYISNIYSRILFGVSEGCINAKKEGREGGKKGRREEGVREINR